jgi:hypothetical protein
MFQQKLKAGVGLYLIYPSIASQEIVSDNELERNVRDVERYNQSAVGLPTNSNVTSGSDENPILPNQLHSMFAAFMADM